MKVPVLIYNIIRLEFIIFTQKNSPDPFGKKLSKNRSYAVINGSEQVKLQWNTRPLVFLKQLAFRVQHLNWKTRMGE